MRRALIFLAFLSFFPLAFLPGDVSGTSPCSNALSPPFIATGVKPNILILLDNSNSFDEDFYGNAVGSYSPASKSVVARQALQSVVTDLQGKANVGIMTFTLPSNVASYRVHNSMPFTSYDPKSYCANPPSDCVTYCSTGDSTAKSNCEAACPGLTTHTYANGSNFPDLLLAPPPTGPYAFNESTGTRARYCGLIYPKTQRMVNPTDSSSYLYWNQPDPMYASSNLGTEFGYCGSDAGSYAHTYSPAENANNQYAFFSTKTGTSDAYNGYSSYFNTYQFQPTDSDWALGFYNFGERMPWYYVGPTWFSSSSVATNPLLSTCTTCQGYLNVAVGDLSGTTQFNNVYNMLAPNIDTSVPAPTNTAYMSCSAGNKNTCSYAINAGNTPTAGALMSAFNFFNGKLSQGGNTVTSPITSSCQKNYIIFVTDGLPDTMLDGSQPTNTTKYCYNSAGQTNSSTCNTTADCAASYNTNCTTKVMGQVLAQLNGLQTQVAQTIGGTNYTYPVNAYVLGMGLTSQAQSQLDMMAVAGGTATSGHAYYANDPTQLYNALQSIITDLLARVAAGSSISILSEGQTQNGDNMLQGVFYPSKYYGTTTINWPGYLYDYWFYNGPTYSNIREDTVHDYILELDQDYALTFTFSLQYGLTVNRLSDPTGSGNASVPVDNVGLDALTPIWEAGKLLFQTSASSRQIYTPGSSATGLVSFDTSNATLTTSGTSPLGTPSTFDPCLQGSSNTVTFQNLVSYIRGNDITNCRNRTVGLCSNATATTFTNSACVSSSDCTSSSYGTCTKNVWKLGDIVYSTPKVQTDYKYCSNGTSFSSQVCSQDSDCTSGGYNSCQKKESLVFVGANDGMLHAFRTGILTTQGINLAQHQVETLAGIPTSSMGTELWSFIPQNSLPYLRCLAAAGGCHLYYSDLSPYITTMVSNGVTKTVLIGGMRLGGGTVTGPAANYCFNAAGVSNGQTCTSTTSCNSSYKASCSSAYPTNAPYDTCSGASTTTGGFVACTNPATCYNPSSCTGLSSYYALDITDAENPKFLWEFSHPLLGYTYSGPAVIHKWADATHLSGDQYYVMFLSGPTNPTDGSSIQDAQVFVLSLNANLGIGSLYYKDLGAGTQNGFGGRLFTSGLDVNSDGYTDFVFFGYASDPSGTSTGWQGGIAKVNTNNASASAAMSPANWTYDISSYSSIAQLPITAQIAAEQCFGNWYLYAGSGRYFFPQDNYDGTSNSGLNYLMGIPFTCDQYNNNCTSLASLNNSATACTNLQKGSTYLGQAGWQYTLNGTSGSFLIERMITDPTISTGNKVYMITSQPTSDPCSYGGQSRVWGLNCATGGAIADTSCSGYSVTDLTGTVYLQTSTGAIYQIDAASSFKDSSTGNRTTAWFIGMPPETAAPVVQPATAPPKTGQLIQWIEK